MADSTSTSSGSAPGSSIPTDEELLAFLDERMEAAASRELERQLRTSVELQRRALRLIGERDSLGLSLGDVWRRHRVSCPGDALWQDYRNGVLSAGWNDYLEFHLRTIGCRTCQATLDSLAESSPEESRRLSRRVFTSTVGRLPDASE